MQISAVKECIKICGYAKYTYEEDETGILRVFENRCGVRNLEQN